MVYESASSSVERSFHGKWITTPSKLSRSFPRSGFVGELWRGKIARRNSIQRKLTSFGHCTSSNRSLIFPDGLTCRMCSLEKWLLITELNRFQWDGGWGNWTFLWLQHKNRPFKLVALKKKKSVDFETCYFSYIKCEWCLSVGQMSSLFNHIVYSWQSCLVQFITYSWQSYLEKLKYVPDGPVWKYHSIFLMILFEEKNGKKAHSWQSIWKSSQCILDSPVPGEKKIIVWCR